MQRIIKEGTPILDGVPPDLCSKIQTCPIAYTQTYAKTLSKTPKGKFKETIRYLQKILSLGCEEYYIYPEFTLMGEIHYHGFLKRRDEASYQSMLPKLKNLGFICMKAIDSTDKWIHYCTKNSKDIEKLLCVKLPISHTTIFKNNKAPQETLRGSAPEEAEGEPSPTTISEAPEENRNYGDIWNNLNYLEKLLSSR